MSNHPFLDSLHGLVAEDDAEIVALTTKLDMATEAARLNGETIREQQRAHAAELRRMHDSLRGITKKLDAVTAERNTYRAQVRVLQDVIGDMQRAANPEATDHLGRDRFDREKNDEWGSD